MRGFRSAPEKTRVVGAGLHHVRTEIGHPHLHICWEAPLGHPGQRDALESDIDPALIDSAAGADKIYFDRLLSRRKRLRLGEHKLTITAADSTGRVATSRRLHFTIVK